MISSSSTGDAMTRLLNRLIGDDRGGAIAEFMLGLIPLVIAFALIFEFGRAFWSHQAVIKGVRDATRYLTRVENPADPAAQAIAQRWPLTGQQAPGGAARWSSGSAPPMEVSVTEVANAGRHVPRPPRRSRSSTSPPTSSSSCRSATSSPCSAARRSASSPTRSAIPHATTDNDDAERDQAVVG